MTTLVTGATGFLGAVLVRSLLERGESVRVLARAASDRRNIEGLDVEVATGDLRDPGSLDRACTGCTTLYHVAADYRLWTRDPDALYASNVEGTRALMTAALAASVERVVYTSSVATLGLNADGTPANEETPVTEANMIGHYKRSKYLAERVVDAFIHERDLPAVIVNPSTPIGPYDIKPTPTGRLIRDAIRGRIPAYVDTGLNVVHVEDVALGHLLAHQHGTIGRRYILGGENMTLREILAEIARLCDRRPPRIKLPRALVYPLAYVSELWASATDGPEPQATVDGLRMSRKRMFFDSSRARTELGYRARPAQLALADAVAWFRGRAATP